MKILSGLFHLRNFVHNIVQNVRHVRRPKWRPLGLGLGLTGESERIRLRNRLGYTLRSAVLAMRWVRIREVGRAVGNIWAAFLVQLKRELVEDFWVAKFGGVLGAFESGVLAGGVLGKLGEGGGVEWGDLLGDTRVGYWELYH